MEVKKAPTKKQIEKRIQNAIVFVPNEKDSNSIFFSDKGLRLTTTSEYAVIATGYHRHVFDSFTSGATVSRPWLYTKRVIDIALENDCKTEDGYSFAKLLETLKAKEDQAEYTICVYYEWWCRIIFDPLYSVDESEFGSWLVYFKYICTIATNSIILEEHKEALTNKAFTAKFVDLINQFTADIDERVIIEAMTDEEYALKHIEEAAKMDEENAANSLKNDADNGTE